MTAWQWVLISIGSLFGLVLLMLALCTIDLFAFHLMRRPQIEIVKRPGRNHSRLIIYLTGAQSSAVKHSAGMLRVWLEYADVWLVEYDLNRYTGRSIVKRVRGLLRSTEYQRIDLIGASMGGLTADDIVLGMSKPGRDVRNQLVDAPFTSADLVDPAAQLAKFIPAGRLFDLLLNRPFWKLTFKPPKPDLLGEGVNWELLDAQHALASRWPLHQLFDEARSILAHPTPQPSPERNGVTANYLQSRRPYAPDADDTIKREAYEHWRRVYPNLGLVEVASTHVGFLEFPGGPNGWEAAFRKVLA